MEIYRNKLIKREYKSFFKQIENITLRCLNCSNIPEFYINSSNRINIICRICANIDLNIIDYILNLLENYQCEICSNKNDLYYLEQNLCSNDCPYSILCGSCKLKYSKYMFISYKTIDKNCIEHSQKYKYSNNLCEKCVLNLNKNKESNIINNISEEPSELIELKDILLSKEELENFKKDINYIETYINGIKLPKHFNSKEKEEKIVII